MEDINWNAVATFGWAAAAVTNIIDGNFLLASLDAILCIANALLAVWDND